MYHHLPLQESPKFTQIGIFGLKINHLATLVGRLLRINERNFFSSVEPARALKKISLGTNSEQDDLNTTIVCV
jgi:hypothetical protein